MTRSVSHVVNGPTAANFRLSSLVAGRNNVT